MKKYIKLAPIAAFCLMLFIMPIMYLITPDSDYSPLEKRKLSQFPIPTAETVFSGEFGEDYETYLSDQVPFRTFFVGTNAYYDLFSGRNGIGGIYRGNDNYLLVSPVKINSTFEKNVQYIDEFLDELKVPSYICIVPSSGFINEDKLPTNHYEYNDDTIIEEVYSRLESDTNISINITDLFRSLAHIIKPIIIGHHSALTNAIKSLVKKWIFQQLQKTNLQLNRSAALRAQIIQNLRFGLPSLKALNYGKARCIHQMILLFHLRRTERPKSIIRFSLRKTSKETTCILYFWTAIMQWSLLKTQKPTRIKNCLF